MGILTEIFFNVGILLKNMYYYAHQGRQARAYVVKTSSNSIFFNPRARKIS